MDLTQWTHLQSMLKEEFILTQNEFEQKRAFEKKLTGNINNYYNSYIQLLQEKQIKQSETQKKILKDDGFGDAYTFVKQVVIMLSKDMNIIKEIIRINDENWSEKWKTISKLIVNNLYENIVEEDIYHKDIMYLLVDLIDIIIASTKKPAQISFSSPHVSSKILRQFTHREQIKKYSELVLKSTLLAISKIDTPLDLEIEAIKSKSRYKQKVEQKHTGNPIISQSDLKNSTKLYSAIFRQYDINKGYTDPKGEPYMSKHLLKFLGVSEDTSYPTFLSKKVRPQKVQEEINKKFNLILEKSQAFDKDNKTNEEIEQNISKIRNIINTFFGSIFKNIYNLPKSIRIICKVIESIIMKRFPNISRSLVVNSVTNFLFTTWLLPEIQYNEKTIATGHINEHNTKNASIIQHLIQKILKNQYTTQNVSYKKQLNNLIKRLRTSIQNYIEQVLNFPDGRLKNLIDKIKEQRISSYSVCLNYEQLRILFDMLLESKEAIIKINDKIINRVIRVRDMTDNFQVLKGQVDKEDKKFYNSQQAYVLFTELSLPKSLQSDYYKQYMETYKLDKAKHLLRQILVSIDSIDYEADANTHTINQLLQNLIRKYKYKKQLNSFDKVVPIDVKIKYLLSIKNCDLNKIAQEMIEEYNGRIPNLLIKFNQTKEQFLKAKESLRKYIESVHNSQQKFNLQKRKKKCDQFLQRTKINICLTSPRTRQGEIAMKAPSVKSLGQEKQRIWLEFQTECIHTTLNLQFIKSLTGEPDKKKKDDTGHCNDIRKFVDVFSNLPEVRQSVITGEDKIGIKENFYEFIKYCIELAKKQPKENALLLANQQWFEQYLQTSLTRRVYERIYPKQQTYNDAAIYFRLKTLDWIEFQHLHIAPSNRVDSLWKIAASSLHEIQQFKTPNQKLDCMIKCTETMTNILSLTSQKDEPASADVTYPIMVYILLKAAPRKLLSNINFIDIFSNSNKMMSGDGYCFIQIKSAISFFEILNQEKLSGITKIQYEKHVYQKEIEYGIYFLKRRPRTEKKPLDDKKLKQLIHSYIN